MLVTAGQVMPVPSARLTSMSASQHLVTMEELATTWSADSLAPVQKVSLGWLVRGTSTSAFRTPARMGHYARITQGALTACANLDLQVQSVIYLLFTSNTTTDVRQGTYTQLAHKCVIVLGQEKYLLLSNWRGVVTQAYSGHCQKQFAVRVTNWEVSAVMQINLSCLL